MVDIVTVGSINDIPALEKKKFSFEQNGRRIVLGFTPLTSEQMEDIRASVPPPNPPEKPIEGLSAQDKVIRKRQGLPITIRDFEDSEYLKQVREHGESVALAMVQRALGDEQEPETFRKALRSRLTAGVLQSLVDTIQNETFRLDSGLVENLEGNSPQSAETAENS